MNQTRLQSVSDKELATHIISGITEKVRHWIANPNIDEARVIWQSIRRYGFGGWLWLLRNARMRQDGVK